MAKNYTEILELVNAGNQMGLSNTIKRDYGIPLDFTSVQESLAAAIEYAATSTKAYVGQPISVGNKLYIICDSVQPVFADVTTVYDNYLAEVGSATDGDGVSIDLEARVLTLHGFDSALTGYLPRKAEDGTLEWVPISEVVKGDGNKVTTLTSSDASVIITKTTDTESSLVYDLKVTPYDDADIRDEIDSVEKLITDETSGLAKLLSDEITRAQKAEKDLDDKVNSLDYVSSTQLETTLVDYAKASDLDTLESRVDAFLTGTGATDALDSLQELIKYIDEHDDADISGIIEDIQGLENKLVGINTTVADYVTNAISNLNIADYAKSEDLNNVISRVELIESKPFDTYAVKSEVENEFKKYTTTSDLTNLLANKADKSDVVLTSAFNEFKDQNSQAIQNAREGAVEDVSKVGYALLSDVSNTYATKDAVTNLDNKIATTLESYAKTSDLTSISALAQQGVDNAALAQTAAEFALTKINELTEGQIKTNTSDIAALTSRVVDVETVVTDYTSNIKPQVQTNKDEIETIKNTTIPGLQSLISEKADASDVYKKSETFSQTEINALLSAKANAADVFTKSETLSEIESALADFDQSALQTQITNNKLAIESIYKVDGESTTGLLVDEIERAKRAENAIDTVVKSLVGEDSGKSIRTISAEETAKIVAGAGEDYDTLKEIAEYIASDKTHAAEINNTLAAHNTILSGIGGEQDTYKTVVEYVSAVIPKLEVATSTTLGGVKSTLEGNNTVQVAADGSMRVSKVGVSTLENDVDELIISGGSATV